MLSLPSEKAPGGKDGKEGFSDCVQGILKLNLRRKKRALFANGPGQSVRLFSY